MEGLRKETSSAKKLALHYTTLDDAAKALFRELPVERQLYLMNTPVKKVKHFKEVGVDEYVRIYLQLKKSYRAGVVARYYTQMEKDNHKIVAEGGSLRYEDNKKRGNKQSDTKNINPYRTLDPRLSFADF